MPKVSHPRFVVFLVLLFGTSALLWRPMGAAHAISLGFDIAAVLFVARIARVMSRSDADDIRRHADENDAGRAALLMIAVALTLVVLVTVATELRPRGMSILEIALPVVTIVIAWFFGNTVYTLHYAHLFYDQVGADESAAGEKGDRGGLDFPECETPDYWDFAYFAFNNGMAFQVSDVRVTTRGMRRGGAGALHDRLLLQYRRAGTDLEHPVECDRGRGLGGTGVTTLRLQASAPRGRTPSDARAR